MAERTLRRPKRPGAYGAVVAAAILILAASLFDTWATARAADPAPDLPIRTGDAAR